MAARGWGLFTIYLYRKLKKSSCQKPLDRFPYTFAEMFLWWSSTKVVQAIWICQKTWPPGGGAYYAPAYSKNSGWALSITPVRPVRLSVCPSVSLSVRPTSCSGHNSQTVWIIFMKLHRCIHHIETMYRTPKPYEIYSWNFTSACITLRWCVMNKEDNSCIFGFWIISAWLSSIQLTVSGP